MLLPEPNEAEGPSSRMYLMPLNCTLKMAKVIDLVYILPHTCNATVAICVIYAVCKYVVSVAQNGEAEGPEWAKS